MFKNKFIQPRSLLLIFLSVFVIVSLTVVHDLHESRDEALSILESQAHSLLASMLTSSEEVLTAGDEVENEINRRLLNNASIIKMLLEKGKVSDDLLEDIAEINSLHRINVFGSDGNLRYTNFRRGRRNMSGPFAAEFLQPIFSGEKDTIIIGLREAKVKEGYRYVAALATNDNGAIVLNLDAEELLDFRKRIGFGILLNRVTENEGIVYTALEDYSGILAASSNVDSLDNIEESEFLSDALDQNMFNWRFANFNDAEIFEAVHPFEPEGRSRGLFRIGLSLDPLNTVYDRITTRIITSSLLLLILGTFILAIVFARQNFSVIEKKYSYMESFSNQLIEKANDIIIVLNENRSVVNINPSGKQFFNLPVGQNISVNLNELICIDAEEKVFNNPSHIIETTCVRENKKNHLLISRSEFRDSEDNQNYVLIIKDLTSIKELEEQVERGKQLTAMGHLASGVAHEIRNPLNAIGTIVQQLRKDFEPVEDKEDYLSFTNLIYNEVKRINRTVQSFLKLARPVPLQRSEFSFDAFMNDVVLQYESNLREHNIDLTIENDFHGTVNWDKDQVKQVFINLITNARDAIKKNGEIKISVNRLDQFVVVKIEDNGDGIPEESLGKIFNLYYTTKAEGNGLGLGITQRIINEHGGLITVDSTEGKGTTFAIKLKSQ